MVGGRGDLLDQVLCVPYMLSTSDTYSFPSHPLALDQDPGAPRAENSFPESEVTLESQAWGALGLPHAHRGPIDVFPRPTAKTKPRPNYSAALPRYSVPSTGAQDGAARRAGGARLPGMLGKGFAAGSKPGILARGAWKTGWSGDQGQKLKLGGRAAEPSWCKPSSLLTGPRGL